MSEPEMKRRRKAITKDVIEFVNKSLIEELIGKMKDSTKTLIPILSDEVTCEIPLKPMLVASVLDKKLISTVIARLNNILPMPECRYLKRVRNSDILLCSLERISADELGSVFANNSFVFHKYFKDEIRTIQVASAPPMTKTQYEKAIKYWPCNFHPNKELEILLNGKYFNSTDIKRHRKYMKLAYEIAEMYEDKLDRKNDSTYDDRKFIDVDENDIKDRRDRLIEDKEMVKKKLQELKGAVIVDPNIDSIVAVGYNRRTHNPCQHPVMIAIDNVAKSQYGGFWEDDSMSAEEDPNENANGLVLNGVPKMFRNILNTTYVNLKFGAISTKRRTFVQEIEDQSISRAHRTSDNETLSCLINKEKANQTAKTEEDAPSGPYLCTGYDLYTTNEPCLMCAMALVHGRIKRVFYGVKNTEKGALGSVCQIHTLPHLNHHFEVFTGFFEEL